LDHDEWKFDPIPEIINGKNIADYIDQDIMERLEELEREEEEREAQLSNQMEEEDDDVMNDFKYVCNNILIIGNNGRTDGISKED
jgi:nucleolar GTP-binding protein